MTQIQKRAKLSIQEKQRAHKEKISTRNIAATSPVIDSTFDSESLLRRPAHEYPEFNDAYQETVNTMEYNLNHREAVYFLKL